MRYFLDTEFIEDGITIDLVSVGVVAEDGREFYREVWPSDAPWHHANDWVLQNVKPHLAVFGAESEFNIDEVARPRNTLAYELYDFVSPRTTSPEIWAYYGAYDLVAIAQLFGRMIDLPTGWPMFYMDIKQLAVSYGNPKLPEQTSTQHHALEDARWNRDTFEWLMQLAQATSDDLRRSWERQL